MLSDEQFECARRLASELAGIELATRHRELLEKRRQRRDGGKDSWEDFLCAVDSGDPSAVQKFLCLLTTKFTGFFRHPRHFEIAAQHALRVVRERDHARLWSAGAATGEESWSLAMALIETFGCDDPPVTILATDVDTECLAIAQRGEYGELAMRAVSPQRQARFFRPEGHRSSPAFHCIAPFVRRLVEFRPLNFADVAWPVDGRFDTVFCRNVLMYLEASHRYSVLERMSSLLAQGGLLLLDPTEHLGKAGHWFRPIADGAYSRSSYTLQRSGADFVISQTQQ